MLGRKLKRGDRVTWLRRWAPAVTGRICEVCGRITEQVRDSDLMVYSNRYTYMTREFCWFQENGCERHEGMKLVNIDDVRLTVTQELLDTRSR